MGSVVSDSSGRVAQYAQTGVLESAVPAGPSVTANPALPLDANAMRALARTIIETEPSEIRSLLRQEPALLHGWVSQIKTQQLASPEPAGVLHEALDHIRLSTLSPLKFAAE